MSYIKQTVKREAGNPGLGILTRDTLLLIDVEDINFFPSRSERGVEINEDIILKKGAYAYGIYMTPGTANVKSGADGDPDQVGFQPTVVFNHPGNKLAVREFKANNLNRKFIGIIRYCSGQPSDLIGSPCNPCTLTPSYTGSNESSVNEFTLSQISKGEDIAIYNGTVPMEEPVAVVEAGETSVVFVSEGQYQLSAGTAVINKITGGSHGALITLVGTPGEAPTVTNTAGAILLKDGKTFVASEGSQITLRAFAGADGEVLWIEQSRFENA